MKNDIFDIDFKGLYYNGCIQFIQNVTGIYNILDSGHINVSTNAEEYKTNEEGEVKRVFGIDNEEHRNGVGYLKEGTTFRVIITHFQVRMTSYTYETLRNDEFQGTEMYGSNDGIQWTLLEYHNYTGPAGDNHNIGNYEVTTSRLFSQFEIRHFGNRVHVNNGIFFIYGLEFFGSIRYPTICSTCSNRQQILSSYFINIILIFL